MESHILQNFSTKCVNQILPAQSLSPNVFSHKITHSEFLKLLEAFRKISERESVLIKTLYKYQDLILEVSGSGMKCLMKPVQSSYFDPETSLMYFKTLEIPLSITRFKPSMEYHWSGQMLIIEINTVYRNATMKFEVIFSEKLRERNAKKELSKVLSDSSYPASISYSLELHDNEVSQLDFYLKLLKKNLV